MIINIPLENDSDNTFSQGISLVIQRSGIGGHIRLSISDSDRKIDVKTIDLRRAVQALQDFSED